jgi:hypothetical protein
MSGLQDKAEAFCADSGIAPATLLQTRLIADMHPYAYQVKSIAVHSQGAIEGVRNGAFSPDTSTPPDSFDGLRRRLAEARAVIEAITPEEMERFETLPMAFLFGTRRIDFTAVNFLLSFSQPNFYFHATTAYDILRMLGVPIGKTAFMGKQRRGL